MSHQSQSHATPPSKHTIAERLKKIESLLMTTSFAALYQHDTNGGGAELYNISETALFASQMLGDIADEMEAEQHTDSSLRSE